MKLKRQQPNKRQHEQEKQSKPLGFYSTKHLYELGSVVQQKKEGKEDVILKLGGLA